MSLIRSKATYSSGINKGGDDDVASLVLAFMTITVAIGTGKVPVHPVSHGLVVDFQDAPYCPKALPRSVESKCSLANTVRIANAIWLRGVGAATYSALIPLAARSVPSIFVLMLGRLAIRTPHYSRTVSLFLLHLIHSKSIAVSFMTRCYGTQVTRVMQAIHRASAVLTASWMVSSSASVPSRTVWALLTSSSSP